MPKLTAERFVREWVARGEINSLRVPVWERVYQERGLIELAQRRGYIRIGRDVACTITLEPRGRAIIERYNKRKGLLTKAK